MVFFGDFAVVFSLQGLKKIVVGRHGPIAKLNFTPEGALLPAAGFEPTTFCGH